MKGKYIAIVVLAILAALVIGLGAIYNGLVRANETVSEAWSQVQNVYQRRMDLIPNLVETVKGYAAHEKATFTAVTEARSRVSQITQNITPDIVNDPGLMRKYQEAQESMGAAIGRLLVTVERYPELKANENFLALQSQLEGTENRIAVERRRFNEVTRAYNVKIKQFPVNLIAGTFNFREKAYFEADKPAGKAPEVRF